MAAVQEKLGELLDVIHEADIAIMQVYDEQSAVVEMKPDDTPVTQADIASHYIVTNGLLRLFPHIPVVSEEGSPEENRKLVQLERFWLVDPLDGTREFLARTGHFTICAALIEEDVPVFGIVSASALDTTYYGGTAMGSYRKDGQAAPETINVSNTKTGIILGSNSGLDAATAAYVAEHYPDHEVRSVGSQLKLPRIAEGLADAYPRLNGPLHLWDLAAGQAILEAAGGSVKRPDGTAIDYHSESLLVGDFIAASR